MKAVELFTRDYQYVATVEIPPFDAWPDVIAWGDRVFTYDSSTARYLEAWIVASLTPPPGLPRKEGA